MKLLLLVPVLVLVTLVLNGCLTGTPATETVSMQPSRISLTPTSVGTRLESLIAEGMPSDTVIRSHQLSRSDVFWGETIEIRADGDFTLDPVGPDGPLPTRRGRMSPETVKSIILEFSGIDFFSLRGTTCVYYVTGHPDPSGLPTRQTYLGMQEFSENEVSITLKGRSHAARYSYHFGEPQKCGDDQDAIEALDRLRRVIHDAVITALEAATEPGQ